MKQDRVVEVALVVIWIGVVLLIASRAASRPAPDPAVQERSQGSGQAPPVVVDAADRLVGDPCQESQRLARMAVETSSAPSSHTQMPPLRRALSSVPRLYSTGSRISLLSPFRAYKSDEIVGCGQVRGSHEYRSLKPHRALRQRPFGLRQPRHKPSGRAVHQADATGTASWYDDGPGLYGAVHSWRWGDTRYVTRVCLTGTRRCVNVVVRDFCGCPGGRVIDLSPAAFRRLTALSFGLVRVTLTRVR